MHITTKTNRIGKNKINLERLQISIQAYLSSTDPRGTFFWNAQNAAKNTSQHIYTDILLLEKIKQQMKELPPKLIILMDNTVSENKNSIYLQWCMMLISLNIFKEIQWIFLPVGHTHWENDQIFSKISVAIKNNINGLKKLQDFFQVCMNNIYYFSQIKINIDVTKFYIICKKKK